MALQLREHNAKPPPTTKQHQHNDAHLTIQAPILLYIGKLNANGSETAIVCCPRCPPLHEPLLHPHFGIWHGG
jgi:hypothetical protein